MSQSVNFTFTPTANMSQSVNFHFTPADQDTCIAVFKQIRYGQIDYNIIGTELKIGEHAARNRWTSFKKKWADDKGAAISFTPRNRAICIAILRQVEGDMVNYDILQADLCLPSKAAARTRWETLTANLRKIKGAGVGAFIPRGPIGIHSEQALCVAVLTQMVIKKGQIDFGIIRNELELSNKDNTRCRWKQIRAKLAKAQFKGVPIVLTPAQQEMCLAILKQIEVDKVDYVALRAEMDLESEREAQLRWEEFIAKLRKRGVLAVGGPAVKQNPNRNRGPVEIPGEQRLCIAVIKQDLHEVDLEMIRTDLELQTRAAALNAWSCFRTKIENGGTIPLTRAEQTMCVSISKQVTAGTVDYVALRAELGVSTLAAARLRWNNFKRKHKNSPVEATDTDTPPSTPADTKKTDRPPGSSGKKRKYETDDEEDWSDMHDEDEDAVGAFDRETPPRPTRRAKTTNSTEIATEDYDHDHDEDEDEEGEEDVKDFKFSSDVDMKLEHHDEHEHEHQEGEEDMKDFTFSGDGGMKLEHHDEHEHDEDEDDAKYFNLSSDGYIKRESD